MDLKNIYYLHVIDIEQDAVLSELTLSFDKVWNCPTIKIIWLIFLLSNVEFTTYLMGNKDKTGKLLNTKTPNRNNIITSPIAKNLTKNTNK